MRDIHFAVGHVRPGLELGVVGSAGHVGGNVCGCGVVGGKNEADAQEERGRQVGICLSSREYPPIPPGSA